MTPLSSWPELVFWQEGDRRCELWMAKGVPELRLFARDTERRGGQIEIEHAIDPIARRVRQRSRISRGGLLRPAGRSGQE